MPRTASARLYAQAQRVIPGGVNSPVRAFGSVGGTPPFIDRARGSRLWDVDGRSYIDYVMSWGPLIHGHAPPGLTKILRQAAQRGTSFGAPTAVEVELGRLVCRLIPSIERVRFVNSGTEATMSAIRVARASTGHDTIIKFAGCYHGHGDSFLVQAGSGATTLGIPTSPGVPNSTAANTAIATYNDLESVKKVTRKHRHRIAAIIVEPIAGNMGVVPPAPGFLEGLRSLCDRHGIVLIFDEVISGFRASKGGAQALLGINPDLTCLGKIIGGGLPVGAYGGRTHLMEMVAPVGPVYQAGTLSGNPLAMTAGLVSGLHNAAKSNSIALTVNAFGSVLTPFFTNQPVTDYASATAADTKMYAAFFHGMLQQGIYPPPSQFEGWFLSAAHSERDIDSTIRAAQKVFAALSTRRDQA